MNDEILKGHRLLAALNIVRSVFDEDPIGEVRVRNAEAIGAVEHALARAACCRFETSTRLATDGSYDERVVLRFADPRTAAAVSKALGESVTDGGLHVVAPDAIESVVIATWLGVAWAHEGTLTGWIEPAAADPSLWQLHLMPGHSYPPGHEPAGHDGPII